MEMKGRSCEDSEESVVLFTLEKEKGVVLFAWHRRMQKRDLGIWGLGQAEFEESFSPNVFKMCLGFVRK